MSEWLFMAAYFLCGAMLLMMLMGLGIVSAMPGIDRWSKRFFIGFFTIMLLTIVSYILDVVVYAKPDLVIWEKIATYCECLFVSLLMPMMSVYLLHSTGESYKTSKFFRTVLALWCVFILLLNAAQFTTAFYYISEDNLYYRGSWHPILMAPILIIMILNTAVTIRRRHMLSKKHFIAILIYLIPMTVAILIHMFYYVPVFIDASIAVCALAMLGIILLDQTERYMRQQKEIAHQHASIMMLQMRPHFIYNTMMSIYYLCDQDAKKAQQVTLDFTTYLRRNFTAIASEDAVPFYDELEHTRAYLAVEQAQFEDSLFVSFDTPHTLFRVPPLTLQPLVENAVKHGMDPDGEPLHILVQTRKTELGSEIIVENDGPDFEPADDNEPHIALANIRQRLELMCGGDLSIASRDGGGTAVTVTIPAE